MAKKPSGGFNLGRQALSQVSEMYEWYQKNIRNQGPGAAEPFTKFGPRIVRFVKLQANSLCSYPSAPADTFPCVWGELTYVNTSCGLKGNTFTAYTPAEDRIVHDYTGQYHESGEVVPAILHHGKWFILPKDDISVVKATACLLPGDNAAGVLMEDVAGTWTATATVVNITDPFCWNCLLPNEIVFARKNEAGDYDIIGSHGLTRKAKCNENIVCGQSGVVTIHSDITSASCNATASNCTVTACNTWGEVRKIYQDEEVTIAYFGTRPIVTEYGRRWIIIPTYFPRWVMTTLAADLCPGDATASVNDAGLYADGCPSVSVTSATNTYNLSGPSGSPVALFRKEDNTWHVWQVKHLSGYFGYDYSADVNANCNFEMILYRERMSYMGCSQFDETGDDVQFHNRTIVDSWSIVHEEGSQSGSGLPTPGTCRIRITTKSVCVLQGPDVDVLTYIDLTPEIVLQDVDIANNCFIGTVSVIYPLCSDQADTVTLFCGTTCESGSGSGSGSGGQ